MKKDAPPKLANRFLEWYCRPEVLEDLQGSLYEYYYERLEKGHRGKARWMFILDVLAHIGPQTIRQKNQNLNSMFQSHLKVSIRNIWKNKLSSALNTVGLASGIVSFVLISLWVNMELKYDQFHEKGEKIYRISNTFKSESETFSQAPSGPALGGQLHKIFAEVENATRFDTFADRIKVDNKYFFEQGLAIADPNFLDMFSFEWTAGDQQTAMLNPNSVILTSSTVKKYFGDANPLGKTITIDQTDVKVTGIMADPPETSQIQFSALLPVQLAKTMWGTENMDENWGGGWFQTYLQLADGADSKEVQSDITTFIAGKLTDWAENGMYYEYFLQPLHSIHLNSNLRYDYANGDLQTVRTFFAAAIIILLLACINYINLATANAISRSKEVGVRKVIGASKRQLISQYLVESLLVVIISVVFAAALVWLLLPFFSELTGYTQLELFTLRNAGYLVALIFTLCLLAGSLPAFLIARVSSLNVIKGNLKSGSQYNLLRKSLVVTQFTATVILLISIFVINDQMSFIQKNDLGMKTDGIARINFRGAAETRSNAKVIKDRLSQIPTIQNISFLRSYPVDGLGNSGTSIETGDGTIVNSSIYTLQVDEEFAETFGVEMASGRFFSKEFPSDTTASIVVNEACIENFGWKDAEDAIGKKFGRAPNERRVIGVAKNFNFEALHRKIEPLRILPVLNNSFSSLAINADMTDIPELLNEIEQIWKDVNPEVPLDISFMDDDLKQQYVSDYNFKSVFTAFAFISVIIGCLGLFGLATATANQRLKEVGIRKVLGASILEIISLINKDFVILVIISVILASPFAYYLMDDWLDNFVYHVTFKWQFVGFALLGALLLTVLTISIRAFKTALTNPAHVLKDE